MTRVFAGLALNDDLEAGLPAPPEQGADTSWADDEQGPTSVADVFQGGEQQMLALLASPETLALPKDVRAAFEARVRDTFRTMAGMLSVKLLARLEGQMTKMGPGQVMDALKLVSTAGNLMPRDEKTTTSPFSLTISLPAGPAPAVVVDGATGVPVDSPVGDGSGVKVVVPGLPS